VGFSYRKKIAPGLTLTASRRGLGMSQRIGVPGAGVSVNTRGRVTATAGAGGLRYQTSRTMGARRARRRGVATPAAGAQSPASHGGGQPGRVPRSVVIGAVLFALFYLFSLAMVG
jgi:hypothetical protein